MTRRRSSILGLVDYYPPAFRAGGAIRGLPGVVRRFSDDFDFTIVTRDQDLGVRGRLPGIRANHWTRAGNADCMYLSASRSWPVGLWWTLRRQDHDILYLNSFFSISFSFVPLLLRRLRLLPRRGLVVAPRGEFAADALAIKRRRKAFYLVIVGSLRLLDDAVWHATSDHEAVCIRNMLGRPRPVVVIAPDIAVSPSNPATRRIKTPGSLEVAFLGRIARMKNLHTAIDALGAINGHVTFNIFGPIEDPRYWRQCLARAVRLPIGIVVKYRGIVAPGEVAAVLAGQHLFFLPSLGESYGHAIVESLLAGCPVLISDRTPWRGLEKRAAGWDIPLSQPAAFGEVLQRCVDMDEGELAQWSAGARVLGFEIASSPAIDPAYRQLFRLALSTGRDGRKE